MREITGKTTIGGLARETGVSSRLLRYYEEHGLLTSHRVCGGHRRYADDAPCYGRSHQGLACRWPAHQRHPRGAAPRDEGRLHPNGWQDYTYWLSADRTALKRINRLIDDVLRDPFERIGKPEPLHHAFAGCWFRRINEEHRLVYLVDGADIVILQARYHYA